VVVHWNNLGQNNTDAGPYPQKFWFNWWVWPELQFFFFLFVVLGFELRPSDLLGRLSPTWAMSSILSCFSYFSNRVSQFCMGWRGPRSSYLCLFVPGTTGLMCSKFNAWLIGWDGGWGEVSLFCPGWSRTSILLICLLSSWDYMRELYSGWHQNFFKSSPGDSNI
jgi:hypothetical protein